MLLYCCITFELIYTVCLFYLFTGLFFFNESVMPMLFICVCFGDFGILESLSLTDKPGFSVYFICKNDSQSSLVIIVKWFVRLNLNFDELRGFISWCMFNTIFSYLNILHGTHSSEYFKSLQ